MKNATLSIQVFGLYIMGLGLIAFFIPNSFFSFFGFHLTNEVWVRVLGAVIFPLGLYYLDMARQKVIPFFRATVWGRAIVALGMYTLVFTHLGEPRILGYAIIETLGPLWTYIAFKKGK